jgi:predicted NBD/HSP70 family sugar kinase
MSRLFLVGHEVRPYLLRTIPPIGQDIRKLSYLMTSSHGKSTDGPRGRGLVKPGTPRVLRGINDRAALELLLEQGPLSRSRLGDLTGLSKPTTAQLLGRLEQAGLVITSGITDGGPGPRAQLYAVNPDAAYVVALDVTPARILAAVADLTGRTIGDYELRTPRRPGPDAVSNVAQAIAGAATSAGVTVSSLRHLAIGTPGAFDPSSRRLRYARHLPGWHDPDLLERLADEVGIPIHVDNDVNLAAVAELSDGVARGVQDFVLLWVDDGLGAAVVLDGRVRVGATGGAGEVAFLPLPGTPLVRDVRRGNAGAFQELCGGPAVLSLARSLGLRAAGPQAAVRTALETPGAGDALLAILGHRLAVGIAAVVAVLDPTLVVLSGSIGLAGGDRLRAEIADELGSLAATRPRLELAAVRVAPVLSGALHTALTAARDDVFDTVRHHVSPGSARPVTRRTR